MVDSPSTSNLLKVFRSEELCLNLSSFLEAHSCWCLHAIARHFMSKEAAPRVRRALHSRQELCDFYTILEIVLSEQSLHQLTLQEVHDAFDCSPAPSISNEQLGQVLEKAHDLFAIHEMPCGNLALSKQNDDPGRHALRTFPVLHSRLACFEATLASQIETLACPLKQLVSDRIYSFLSAPSKAKPGRRRLSRQSSVTVPKNANLQNLGERMKNFQSARKSMEECKDWISIIEAAQTAHAALEGLIPKGDVVTVDQVHRILTAHQSKFRCGAQVSAEKVPKALLLLMTRSLGGLTVDVGRRPAFCLQPFQGLASCKLKRALQDDLDVLHTKRRRLASRADHAFLATMQDNTGAVSSNCDEAIVSPS